MTAETINGHGPGPGESPAGLIPGQRAPLTEVAVTKLGAVPAGSVDDIQDAVPAGFAPAELAPVDDAPPADVDQDEELDPEGPVDVDQDEELEEGPGLLTRARAIVTHRYVRTTVRNGVYVAAGARVVVSRTRDARTTARHERMMRAAEAAGDHATAKEWEQRAEAHRKARHDRRMALLATPVIAAKSLVYGAAGLFALGILLAFHAKRIDEVVRPLMDVAGAVAWMLSAAAGTWGPIERYGPWVLLAALWGVGRARAEMPSWLVTVGEDQDELVIDEHTITLALKALSLKPINAHLKAGLPLQYITPARTDGRGTFAAIRLPAGIPAKMIAEKKRVELATGLHRAAKEVWPTVGDEAGILHLWIADKGALAEGAGPYPLLEEGVTDFFVGFPFGKTLRGTPVVAPVNGRNSITGGQPGQGKSSSARALMTGAALDPTCELRIWIPDANFDFEGFKPRCSKYVMGAETEKIAVILKDLEELKEEIQERGQLLVKYREPEVTRALANRDHRLRPLMCLLEEAHVALNHALLGKLITGLCEDILRLGRKRAVHFIVSTQAPTAKSISRDITRNCSNGLAFAVSDHVANDAILGAGAYKGGHRATELLPGVDIGTCLAKGLTGERSDIVQVYFIDITRANDQLTGLIRRSLEAVKARNAAVLSAPEVDTVKVDALADVAEVMRGEVLVPSEEVVHRLKVLRPEYYATWTTVDLKASLAPHDAAPRKATTARTMHVDLDLIREAIGARESKTAETEGSGE